MTYHFMYKTIPPYQVGDVVAVEYHTKRTIAWVSVNPWPPLCGFNYPFWVYHDKVSPKCYTQFHADNVTNHGIDVQFFSRKMR